MFSFYFLILICVVGVCPGISKEVLPSWITENPGFKNPENINSTQIPFGSITESGPGAKGWLVFLNEKKGHGIEIEINKLCLETDSDFLMVAPWPMLTNFKQIKIFTGNFDRTLHLQIPNTKAFFILYNTSNSGVSKMVNLQYRRYGSSLEVDSPTTERPVKKNVVFEVRLKGKPPEDYSNAEFLKKIKEGLRVIAGRYSLARNISFNHDIPTEEMVRIHRVSFCPLEWPERNICASVEHSIFVSGANLLENQITVDYELTAEHLRDMWSEGHFPELNELGITVFILPETTDTILLWLLITGLIIIGSLTISFLFWKADKQVKKIGPRKNSIVSEDSKKKPKLKLGKHSGTFTYDSAKLKYPLKKHEDQLQNELNEVLSKPKFEKTFESESSSELPIKNYYGSLLFASNAAFEDDEGNPVNES